MNDLFKGVAVPLLTVFALSACKESTVIKEDDLELTTIAINEFYSALNVKNYREGALDHLVTTDFRIFESGMRMNISGYHKYLSHVDPEVDPLSATSWTIGDVEVSSDENSVHARYSNRGRFEHGAGLVVLIEWLESAYFVRTPEGLRLQFMNVNMVSKEIN